MSRAEWSVGRFVVVSYGNGLAYDLRAPDGASVFLQGDDAADWLADYERAEDAESFIAQTIADHA